ncbi:hypothetical protein ACFOWE_17950 [Planomonospora corallina]|uniref:Uncharacterized protein n=1 Tax=Planomonospora corallina TaxID=1806052 RepID=A0ABV8IB17_9ACTN
MLPSSDRWAAERAAELAAAHELTPQRCLDLLLELADRGGITVAYWDRDDTDLDERPLTDEEWARVEGTPAWGVLTDVAYEAVSDAISDAIAEAGIR